ncbi:hypothetical protein [Aliarcobacter cryaerophilus]|uniref:hypothetical protein n=1 Tax=Aliarcobacter cryaerophilus TaxID=28198 RepID=UPI0021B58BC1|nr:hypothetical protein [Aliarcobacter cryaerophilus]MCT7521186.1 hypothetical protein [Aliarcobacter cryaerophilus]
MKDTFKIKIKNLFKENENFDKKVFLLNVCDEILLEKSNKSSTYSGVYLKIFISKKSTDLHVKLSLFALDKISNYVPIKKSIWSQDSFEKGKYITKIKLHYKKVIKNLLLIFKQLKHFWQLKELIYQIENPKFIFHYKLLNTFSQEILEKIFLTHFENYPILNIPMLRNYDYSNNFKYIFLPKYVSGFYIDDILVRVSSKDDLAEIKDVYNGVIHKLNLL